MHEYRSVGGVHFLRVQGDAVERARAHGRLLRSQIATGAMPVLAKKNEWIIRRSPGIVQIPAVQNAIVGFYRRVLMPFLRWRMDPVDRASVAAFAEESGLSFEQCCESLFQADGLMLLARISLMKYVLPDLPSGGLPGCSSAVALSGWTANGRLMACRNQDYPVVGPWERNTTVVFHEPSEPGAIPHVAVTTAGVETAGLTSMNREGLTLFTHAHFGRHVNLLGKPVVQIGEQVVQNARTIGEAVDIVRKNRSIANWAFVVSSARENEAVAIEITPKRVCVRPTQDGFIAHSNYFHSKELQADEAMMSGSCCDDLVARVQRLRQILEEHRGSLEPSHFARALGDHVDPLTDQERVYGNTLSVVTTVKSVVFDPGAQRFWLSNRSESPTGLGDFIGFAADTFWSSPEESRLPDLQGYQPRNPALIEGVRLYREAYRAWHMENERDDYAERALARLRRALRAFPQDGNLWLQAGIVAFKLCRFDEARVYFDEAGRRVLARHSQEVARLFLARCLDLAGERERAREIYSGFAGVEDPKLRHAMKRGLRRPYTEKQTRLIQVDLQFPDAFHY